MQIPLLCVAVGVGEEGTDAGVVGAADVGAAECAAAGAVVDCVAVGAGCTLVVDAADVVDGAA